jgi:asparagine synthase (glutamine-hydrolysing)
LHLSTAIVPYLNICANARRSLTVMLEGQGADELLGGYAFLYPFATADYLAAGSLRQAWLTFAAETRAGNLRSTLGNLLAYSSQAFAERASRAWGSEVLPQSLLNCRHPDPLRFGPRRDNLDHALRNEHTRRLRNLLQYGDALSMSVNLETRCPFMDFRVVEFGFRLPMSELIRAGTGKHILRRIADGHLDRDITWPARKDGFTNKTVPRLRDHVARHGISMPAVQDAIGLGLLQHSSNIPSSLMQLPDEPFYRIMGTLMWIDQWAGRAQPGARHGMTGNLAQP